jgi:hypothetical protein
MRLLNACVRFSLSPLCPSEMVRSMPLQLGEGYAVTLPVQRGDEGRREASLQCSVSCCRLHLCQRLQC